MVDLQAQRARIGTDVDAAIARVLQHGAFVNGPEVHELEAALAERAGGGEAVACASGTDALVMAMLALGIGPGDAVFVPAFTFVATAEAVVLCGATPVFVDVDEASTCMDPASVERAAAGLEGLRPAAVVPVDLYGRPADYGALHPVAERLGATVVADAAQSFGAALQGRPVGSLAPITSLSFFPSKPLGCYGDGGAVLAQDPALAEVLRSIRAHGQGGHRYEHVRIGLNGRLDTLQAAVLLQKLRVFDDELVRRDEVARRYDAGLAGVVATPERPEGASSAWAQYTIRSADRDGLADALSAAGIATAIHYPCPLHRQPAYRDQPADPAGLPVAEALAASVLSLPMHPYLAEDVQDRIIETVRAAA
jgi:dTDP-4-amino-4,6-dideoxygalactose transaminase